MADDTWKRFREREDEREAEEAAERMRKESLAGGVKPREIPKDETDRLLRRFDEAQKMIEQLNSLYNMYLCGAEKSAPAERRRILDKLMHELLNAHKPTQTIMFRWGTLNASYALHRDKWDRQLKDLEKGKIKRKLG